MNRKSYAVRSVSLGVVVLCMLSCPTQSEAQFTWTMEKKENWFPSLPSGWSRDPCAGIPAGLGCAFGPDGSAVTLRGATGSDLQALLAAVNPGTEVPNLPLTLRTRNETEVSSAVIPANQSLIILATVFRPWGVGSSDARIMTFGASRADYADYLPTALGIMALVRQQYATIARRVASQPPPTPPSLIPTPPIIGDSSLDLSPAKYRMLRNGMAYADVIGILGFQGVVASVNGPETEYKWTRRGRFIYVTFENDRVVRGHYFTIE